MIWRLVMAGMQLGMLALGGLALWSAPLVSPAFSPAARAALPPQAASGPDGAGAPSARWRAGGPNALFEVKEYRLALAWSWLAAARDGDAAARADAARTAGAHARIALAEGPANAFAWVALAWSHHVLGEHQAARDAIEQSWRWAPRARSLAFMRASLESRWWPELTAAQRTRLLGDVLRAQSSNPEGFAALIREDARFATLSRLARRLGRERVGPSAPVLGARTGG
ncbi:MAG: hypothetical protein RQ752_04665 [Thermohalobaculum sp.]|nr:hypothetical protein [Thermohalobaculum sp.]